MNSFRFATVAAWLFVGAFASAQQPEPARVVPEPAREPVGSSTSEPKFHPSLLVGVRALAHEQVRLGELGIRIERGDAEAEKQLYDELREGLPDEVRRAVESELPDLQSTAEVLLAWKGCEVFQQVVDDAAKRKRPLLVDDLLAVAWSDRLRDVPSESEDPEVAAFAKRLAKLYGRTPPLRIWWANVGYLFFAALHTPAFWPAEPEARDRARAHAIEDLLSIVTTSIDSDVARSVVDVALQPPLSRECRRKAVTCARSSLDPFRGKVGFTRDHLDLVSKFDEDVASQRRSDPVAAARDSNFGRLAEFMASLKLRILREIDPVAAQTPSPLAMKYGTVDESLAYYRQLLDTLGVQSFWNEAKHDVERMLSGKFPHPLDAKIAVLEERLADTKLLDDERQRLEAQHEELVRRRLEDQRRISSFIACQFGWLAPLDQAVDELHRIDALATPEQQQSMLDGWIVMVQRDASWAQKVVQVHLHSEDRFSSPAIAAACLTLSLHADDFDCARLVADVATRGNSEERETALLNAKLWPEPLARSLFDTTTADVEALLKRNSRLEACKPSGDDWTYTQLLHGSIDLLYERRGEPWTRDALLATFDRDGVNLWKGGSPFSAALPYGNREILDWIADSIDDESWKKLAEGGRIPEALARVREERRSKRGGTK